MVFFELISHSHGVLRIDEDQLEAFQDDFVIL